MRLPFPKVWLGVGVVLPLVFADFGLAQSAADQRAAMQKVQSLVPKVGHSVARIEVVRDGETTAVGGFVAGRTNWIVTRGRAVKGASKLTVSFKKSPGFEVAGVKHHDQTTDIAVLELATDSERVALEIADRVPPAKQPSLAFDVPEHASVGLSIGPRLESVGRRRPQPLADLPIDRSVSLTRFNVAAGAGTPIIGLEGQVVGVAVSQSESGRSTYAIDPGEVQRVLETALNPQAATAAAEETPMPAGATEQSPYRVWTARNGKYTTKARYLQQKAGKVQLQQPSGQKIVVDIDRLSDEDQAYLQEQL